MQSEGWRLIAPIKDNLVSAILQIDDPAEVLFHYLIGLRGSFTVYTEVGAIGKLFPKEEA